MERYLHAHIPLSAAMGVRVSSCSVAAVELTAPLEPNINHRATAFGGSLSAVAILSAWSWLHFVMRESGRSGRLVIQSNQIDYLEPVTGAFTARCAGVDAAAFAKFGRMFDRHGRARLRLDGTVRCGETLGATFSGEFVALR